MKKYTILLFTSLALANDSLLFEEAKKLEEQKEYKKAMLIYKKLAEKNPYIISDDLDSNTNLKEHKQDIFDSSISKTDDKETNKSIEQIITKDFGIFPYKKNYFLPATYTFKEIKGRKNFETAFQISLEKPVINNFLGFNETLSLGYTQRSFWQTALDSAPFRETNYEPEVFLQVPLTNFDSLKLYKIGFLHTSNGRNEEKSRSLNRIYLQAFFQFDKLFISPKIWYRIPESEKTDDNKDFYKYYGYADINFLYAYKHHTFELMLRNNLRLSRENKGALEFNWSFPLPEFLSSKNTYGLFQVFHGYGQSLIDYDREITNIGLGIAFSR